jgi:hypothetical protein
MKIIGFKLYHSFDLEDDKITAIKIKLEKNRKIILRFDNNSHFEVNDLSKILNEDLFDINQISNKIVLLFNDLDYYEIAHCSDESNAIINWLE